MKFRLTLASLTFAVALLASPPGGAQGAQAQQIQNALDVLKKVCVTGGSTLDLSVTADGGLMLRGALAGAKGSLTLNKKELEGLVDAASSLAGQQASEMRVCMKPWVDRLVEAALTGAVTSGPKTIVLNTEGTPFNVLDYDKLMGAAAARGSDTWKLADLKKATPIAPAKVEHYIEVAIKNKMATYDRYRQQLTLTPSGIAYAVARDLVK